MVGLGSDALTGPFAVLALAQVDPLFADLTQKPTDTPG